MPERKTQLATLCYLRHDGKTLMLHRIKKMNDVHKDKWNGLGGKFQFGETPEECVIREVREESGLQISNPKFKGILMFPLFTPDTDWLVFLFTATEFAGDLSETNEGNLEWVKNEEIEKLPLWEGDKIFLPWLDQEKLFSGKFIYENKKLKNHSVIFH